MGEIVFFEFWNYLLEFVMRKLASVFFEDGLGGFGRWRVEQHDRSRVLSKRFREA